MRSRAFPQFSRGLFLGRSFSLFCLNGGPETEQIVRKFPLSFALLRSISLPDGRATHSLSVSLCENKGEPWKLAQESAIFRPFDLHFRTIERLLISIRQKAKNNKQKTIVFPCRSQASKQSNDNNKSPKLFYMAKRSGTKLLLRVSYIKIEK